MQVWARALQSMCRAEDARYAHCQACHGQKLAHLQGIKEAADSGPQKQPCSRLFRFCDHVASSGLLSCSCTQSKSLKAP